MDGLVIVKWITFKWKSLHFNLRDRADMAHRSHVAVAANRRLTIRGIVVLRCRLLLSRRDCRSRHAFRRSWNNQFRVRWHHRGQHFLCESEEVKKSNTSMARNQLGGIERLSYLALGTLTSCHCCSAHSLVSAFWSALRPSSWRSVAASARKKGYGDWLAGSCNLSEIHLSPSLFCLHYAA